MKKMMQMSVFIALISCSNLFSLNEPMPHPPEDTSKSVEKSLFEQLEGNLKNWRSYFARKRKTPSQDPDRIAALHHYDKLELALSSILDAERHRIQMGFLNSLLLIRETMHEPGRDLKDSALILEMRLSIEFKRQREQTELNQIEVARRLLQDRVTRGSEGLMYMINGKHTLELFQAIEQEIQKDTKADKLFLQQGLALSEAEIKQYKDVLLLGK